MRTPLLISLYLTACSVSDPSEQDPDPAAAPLAAHLVAPIRDVARACADWDIVGPHVSWSPFLCSSPPAPRALWSEARASSEHAQKLYVLRSNQPKAYLALGEPAGALDVARISIGAALVKESYAPVACALDEAPGQRTNEEHRLWSERGFVPFAEKDGRTYRVGEPRDLFVMLKMPAGTPDTMRGWAFGTVTPAGQVTSAGAVGNCVSCHEDAPHDGLFGWSRD